MTIHKPSNYVEVYRLKAQAADIHEMSGRSGRADLTGFVSDRIVEKIQPHLGEVILDVGCGDASLLRRIARATGPLAPRVLVGVLPSAEEVARVQADLGRDGLSDIQILQGTATAIPLPDGTVDKVVLNGVLLLLSNDAEVVRSLGEIHRVCKPSAKVYLGEIPDRNEFADRPYGESILAWLWWVLRTQGSALFWGRCKQVARAAFGSDPFVVLPKRLFFSEPQVFVQMLRQNGFDNVQIHKHVELNLNGGVADSATRWNYLANKA